MTKRVFLFILVATGLFLLLSVSGCVEEQLREQIHATALAEEEQRISSLFTATAAAVASMTPVSPAEIDTTPPAGSPAPTADPDITPFPTFAPMSMRPVEPRPSFISAVAPREYTQIPRDIYNTTRALSVDESAIHLSDLGVVTEDGPIYRASICVRLRALYLVQPGQHFVPEGFVPEGVNMRRVAGRMDLFVNDQRLDDLWARYGGTLVIDPQTERAYMENSDYCWQIPLEVGRHKVTFQFERTSGDALTYTWYFEIVQ